MAMRVLVFGAKGWIGGMFAKNTAHNVIEARSRAESSDAEAEIVSVAPDCVVSFLGRTHGPGFSTIDYLEQPGKLVENMRDNFLAPINLAQICQRKGIHYVYLGTGCIYSYSDTERLFNEDSVPNFFGSSYSIIKGFTDQEIRKYDCALQLRIRMPISATPSPRNLIDKLVSYTHIYSIPNSMTVLDDMWPILDRMISTKTTGTFNMVNPGCIDHKTILTMYKEIVDPLHEWNDVSYEEQMKYIKSHRSNNELSTAKLEEFVATHADLKVPAIQESVLRCVRARCE